MAEINKILSPTDFSDLSAYALGYAALPLPGATVAGHRLDAAAWLLILPAVSAFFAMNFTGASTYTSLSGVKREMRFAVPAQIAGVIIGVGLWVMGHFA